MRLANCVKLENHAASCKNYIIMGSEADSIVSIGVSISRELPSFV